MDSWCVLSLFLVQESAELARQLACKMMFTKELVIKSYRATYFTYSCVHFHLETLCYVPSVFECVVIVFGAAISFCIEKINSRILSHNQAHFHLLKFSQSGYHKVLAQSWSRVPMH